MSDTSPDAARLQAEIIARMTPEERLRRTFELMDLTRGLLRAGLRAEHPRWTEREISREMLRLALLPEPLPERLR